MNLPCAFLSHQVHIELLVLAQLHNKNGIIRAAILILVGNWDYTLLGVNRLDVVGSDIQGDLIAGADSLKFEVNLAPRAIEELAGWATFTVLIVVNIVASQGDQPDSVSDELIMQGTGVLVNLNQIDRHSGYL